MRVYLAIIFIAAMYTVAYSEPHDNSTKEIYNVTVSDVKNISVAERNVEEKKSGFKEKIELINSLIPLAALLFGVVGYFGIVRTLKSENIKKIIDQDFERRKNLDELCTDQINELIMQANENNPIKMEEIDLLFEKSKIIYKNGSINRTEIANLSYLLHHTFRFLPQYYKSQTNKIPFRDVYYFYMDILHLIKNHCIKNVAFPSMLDLLRFTRSLKVDKRLRKYISKSNFKVLNFLELGVNLESITLDTFIFFERLNRLRDPIFSKAAFRVYGNNKPILRILYLNKIYFPPIIQLNKYDASIFSDKPLELYLIGFHITKNILVENDMSVEFNFAPKSDFWGLPEVENAYEFYSDIEDCFLKTPISSYNFKSVSVGPLNVVTYKVSHQDCVKAYKETKRRMKNVMKKNV